MITTSSVAPAYTTAPSVISASRGPRSVARTSTHAAGSRSATMRVVPSARAGISKVSAPRVGCA
jgi:hypothetical protein